MAYDHDEDNEGQIADWNGVLGERWAELRAQIEGVVAPFGDAALRAAAARPGESVLDIGCGCGDTTIELARQVGASGRVLGVDVSRPMLAVARARHAAAAAPAVAALTFEEADAACAPLPAGIDLLFSRFGVMFFAHPAAALRHLRSALRPGGRLVFVCWRTPRDNGWAMTPLVAARRALGVETAPADPLAPGPFAFADDTRLRGLLAEAGFAGTSISRFDAPVFIGDSPRSAAENALRIGPASSLLRSVGAEQAPRALAAITDALAVLAAADGRVHLPGSAWVVTASNP